MARDADVRVVTAGFDPPAVRPDEPFELVLMRSRMMLERPMTFDLWRLLDEIEHADAVHLHTPYPGIELAAALLARIANKPVTVTYHMDAISAHGEKPGRLGAILEWAYDFFSLRPALRLARQIATNSLLYIDYSRVLPRFRTKVRAMHQGIRADRAAPVDPAGPRRDWKAKLAIEGDPVLIGFVGRLVRYKGLHVAIPAFARAVRQGLDARFLIGGKGPEREQLEALAKQEGVEARVHFLGYMPDDQLSAFFAAVDIVVSPSVSPLESTPITLLEAMAQGTAVIGSEVGGTAETVVPGGFNRIVKAEDVDGLCAAILELAGAAHRAPKQPRYPRTWDTVAQDYEALVFGKPLPD